MSAVLGSKYKDDLMIFEQIDPMIILAAVAHNPLNQELELEWRYQEPIINALSIEQTYLIVTEGKSDTRILKRAFEILCPKVNDFFDFIEMNDNYPFSGAGNLSNFFRGLLKVRTNRQMIFVFDNDTAGQFEVSQLKKLKYPSNFKLFVLPDLPDFENFDTNGINGLQKENVNGKAVAIEMFLDFRYKIKHEPIVNWTEKHPRMNQYQGALANKDDYVKVFTKMKVEEFGFYDTSKLKYLLSSIINTLIS